MGYMKGGGAAGEGGMGGGEGGGGVAKAATPLYKTHNIRNHLNTEVIEAG